MERGPWATPVRLSVLKLPALRARLAGLLQVGLRRPHLKSPPQIVGLYSLRRVPGWHLSGRTPRAVPPTKGGHTVKPALLVIDMQKAFCEYGPVTAQSLDEAVEYINAAIALFREKGLPVVCIQHMNQAEGPAPGQEGFEVLDGLRVLPEDLHIHKSYSNSFTKTELLPRLQALGVDTVIVTGFCAEYCVLSTYRGAWDVDLAPVILRGALASTKPENIPFVERISDVISLGALKQVLG